MSDLNLCNFDLLRARDIPCGCAPPPLQCEVEEFADLPVCDGTGTAYYPAPYPPNTPIENGDVFVVTEYCPTPPCPPNATIPTPFFFWDCAWYPFGDGSIAGDADWFKEGTVGPFYGGVITDKAYHSGRIAVRRTTVRGNAAIDVGDDSGSNDGQIVSEGLYTGASPTLPITSARTRLMWLPRIGAFRAGGVDSTQWDAGAIGDYSTSFGINNISSGTAAFSTGQNNVSQGDWTFTAGENNFATIDSAVAFGDDNDSLADDCFTIGAFNTNSINRGFVSGRENLATSVGATGGDPLPKLRAFIHGWNCEVNGTTSFVVGEYMRASGDRTMLFGASPSPTTAWYTQSESFITHRLRPFLHAPDSAPVDGEIAVSQTSFWVDEGANDLVFRVRYSTGIYRTGRLALVP